MNATADNPTALSSGIMAVWVNGHDVTSNRSPASLQSQRTADPATPSKELLPTHRVD